VECEVTGRGRERERKDKWERRGPDSCNKLIVFHEFEVWTNPRQGSSWEWWRRQRWDYGDSGGGSGGDGGGSEGGGNGGGGTVAGTETETSGGGEHDKESRASGKVAAAVTATVP
jgi:hypothetical protein